MKLILWILIPASVGAFGLHYGFDQKYVSLSNNERLFNSKIYESRDAVSSLGHDLKGHVSSMTDTRSASAFISSSIEDRAYTVVKLADYSLKIQTPCSSGTGWFLDYEIPKGGKTYPTKWWIATNAHVISNYKFAGNPYDQVLPISGWQRGCSDSLGNPTQVYLARDNRISNGRIGDHDVYTRAVGDVGSSIDSVHWDARNSVPAGANFVYSKLNNPKLFYVPTNFLGKRYDSLGFLGGRQIRYIKDFAVLEVDFDSEAEAKNFTNDFYGKMNSRRNGKLNIELNLFSDELKKTHTGNDLLKNEEDYIFAGYPGSQNNRLVKHSMTSNFSSGGEKVGKLIHVHSGDPRAVKNQEGKALPGHYRGSQTIKWGGSEYSYWGYEYAITNMNQVAPGASGSLVSNTKGNILGILTSASVNDRGVTAFVTPLKSEGYSDGSKIIDPKYDLIQGSEWQLGSYREQLAKYHPGLETYLSRKWSTKTF